MSEIGADLKLFVGPDLYFLSFWHDGCRKFVAWLSFAGESTSVKSLIEDGRFNCM